MSETSEVLRRAAGLMRERAEAATPGPWRDFTYGDRMMHYVDAGPNTNLVASGAFGENADAAHIASWHPAVALAVADWLEEAADHLDVDLSDESLDICPTAREGAECSVVGRAVTVARAYLGADQ
jgi:hypothetical protein